MTTCWVKQGVRSLILKAYLRTEQREKYDAIDTPLVFYFPPVFKTEEGIKMASVCVAVSIKVLPYILVTIKASFLKVNLQYLQMK